jgi:hypothetical protein
MTPFWWGMVAGGGIGLFIGFMLAALLAMNGREK